MQKDYNNIDSNNNFTAKKSLGQNFIHAPFAISAMIHASNIEKGDIILETGPGKGALTEKILNTGAKIIAVEKDNRAIPFLKEKFKKEIENGQLTLIHNDILEFDIAKNGLINRQYKIIANIPYYISGEFIRKFLESTVQPKSMTIMVQKEVAKRIIDTKESLLSISVKVYGKPKYIASIPRKFFRPIPNVDSAILAIYDISKDFFVNSKIDEKNFFNILKAGFAHKRKVLIRNLEEKIDKSKLEEIWKNENLDRNIRAENLSPEMWKKIIGNS